MMLPTLMTFKDDVAHPNQPIEDPGLLNPQEGVDTPGEGVLLLQGGHRGTGHLKQKNMCYILFKGMVHLIQDMASDDEFGPPELSDDGQTVILCKKYADFTLFVCKI